MVFMVTDARYNNVIQWDLADEEVIRLVELIDTFSFSTNFIHWVSNGNYSSKPVHEDTQEGRFTTLQQYYIGDDLILSGRGEFYLDKAQPEWLSFFKQKNRPPLRDMSGTLLFTKKPLSRVITESYYMVISEWLGEGEVFGTSWEFFELPPLIELHQNKQDPLGYWKSDRRE